MDFKLSPPTFEFPHLNRTILYRKRGIDKRPFIPMFQSVTATPQLYRWVTYNENHILFTSHDGDVLQERDEIDVAPEVIIEEVSTAVCEAYEMGIYHTDIHPKNICVKDGEITVIDWFDAYTEVPLQEPLFCTWCPPEVVDFVDSPETQTVEDLRRIVAYQIGELIQYLPENEYSKAGVGEELTRETAEERLLVSEFIAEYCPI